MTGKRAEILREEAEPIDLGSDATAAAFRRSSWRGGVDDFRGRLRDSPLVIVAGVVLAVLVTTAIVSKVRNEGAADGQ